MLDPIGKLALWLEEETQRGNPFPQGAVLATQGRNGMPRSRMVRVSFDQDNAPAFFASRVSRKISDIEANPLASLTFAFQTSLRSVSIEGRLEPMRLDLLEAYWSDLDAGFRRKLLVCGERSGQPIDSTDALAQSLSALPPGAETARPDSFVGFRMIEMTRADFHAVSRGGIDQCELYERATASLPWQWRRRVP